MLVRGGRAALGSRKRSEEEFNWPSGFNDVFKRDERGYQEN
jgi:hypothetical protein